MCCGHVVALYLTGTKEVKVETEPHSYPDLVGTLAPFLFTWNWWPYKREEIPPLWTTFGICNRGTFRFSGLWSSSEWIIKMLILYYMTEKANCENNRFFISVCKSCIIIIATSRMTSKLNLEMAMSDNHKFHPRTTISVAVSNETFCFTQPDCKIFESIKSKKLNTNTWRNTHAHQCVCILCVIHLHDYCWSWNTVYEPGWDITSCIICDSNTETCIYLSSGFNVKILRGQSTLKWNTKEKKKI